MSRTDRAAAGFATSVAQYGVQILLQAALAPVILRAAGQETLGAYAILMQAIGYLALTDFGLSVSISRLLAQAYGADDGGIRFASLLRLSQRLVLVSNLAFSVGLVILGIGVGKWFGLSASVGSDARLGIAILGVWALVRTPAQVFGNGLIAAQDLAARNTITIAANTLRLVLSLAAAWSGLGLAGLMAAGALSEATDMVSCAIRYRARRLPFLALAAPVDRSSVHELFRFGANVLLINIATRLVLYTGNLVSGYLFGAIAASIFYATQMPSLVGWNIVHRIVDNSGPAINELFGQSRFAELKAAFLRIHRLTLLLLLPLVVGIAVFNRALVTAWVGPGLYAGDLASVSLAGFALVMSLANVSNVFVMAEGKISRLAHLAIAEGVANLTLSLVLGRLIGLGGILLAAFLANIPTSIYLQVRAQRLVGVSWKELWAKSTWPVFRVSAPAASLLLAWRCIGGSPSILEAVFAGTIFVTAEGVLSWLYILTSEDRRQLRQLIMRRATA